MIYLLDTNTCVTLLRRLNPTLEQRIAALPPDVLALCPVVEAELYIGAYRSARVQHNLTQVQQFVQQFTTLPCDRAAAQQAGLINADLTARGTPIGPYDLLIAAIALAHNATLVTHNVREFSRVTRLQYVDWQAGP